MKEVKEAIEEIVRLVTSPPETVWMVLSVISLFFSLIFGYWFLCVSLAREKKPVKIWVLVLPFVEGWWRRGILLLLALLFLVPGAWGIWSFRLRPGPTLTVCTGLSSEELEVFRQVAAQFEKDHKRKVRIGIENVSGDDILSKLKEKDADVDLITFDINGPWYQLVHERLIEDLSEQKHKGLMPSSVNTVLLRHLKVNGIRYFMPFRPNVQIVFWNKEKFKDVNVPETWQDVQEVAREFHERDGEVRVVIQAHKDDVHLTLYQLIRSAGGDPFNLRDSNTFKALKFLRTLQPYILPKSSEVNWQTASGFLLTDSVYLARNWSFSASVINKAGRNEEFETGPGWRWEGRSNPFNLLGGEFLALPRKAPHRELAIEFMKFLMSRDVQKEFANKLVWPAIRLDAMGGIQVWQKDHQIVINEALQYARPLPADWCPHMPDIYREMFQMLVDYKDMDTESILAECQKKINAARKRDLVDQ